MKKFLLFAVLGFVGTFLFAGDEVIVKQKQIEYDSLYFKNGTYYSTDGIRQQQLNQQEDIKLGNIIRELQELRRIVTELAKCLNDNGVPVPNPNIPNIPPVLPNPPVQPAPTPNTPSLIDERVYYILRDKCAQCHNEKNENRLTLFDNSQQAASNLPLAYRALIHEVTFGVNLKDKGLKRMPPGQSLDDDSVEILRQWMLQEAKRERERK